MKCIRLIIFLSSFLAPRKTNQVTIFQTAADGRTVILQRKWHFFSPINVWTAATTTTQHVYNIKYQVKYRHRQNDIYSETLLKSHSFNLLIPFWKWFPAIEANSFLFKHNLSQPPTSCFFSSRAGQESSVPVFTCSGEQTAQPGLVWVCEF